MSEKLNIVTLTSENIDEYGCPCFMNAKEEGHKIKLEWAKKQLKNGLRIKLMFIEGEKKNSGFIEYIPGEFAWRAVDAKGYMFIHCIWVYPKKNLKKGYASMLIEECINDAKAEGMLGVAVVASTEGFLAHKDLFAKNGFETVATTKPSFELLVKKFKKDSPSPKFNNTDEELKKYKGLTLIYANQCPWIARSINDLKDVAKKNKVELNVVELQSAKDAQNAPSIYGTYSLVYNEKLIVDHYISTTRFQNILNKELK